MRLKTSSKMEQPSLFGAGVTDRAGVGQASLFLHEPSAADGGTAAPVEPPSLENAWLGVDSLDSLRKQILACEACALRRGARGVVFGEGNPEADIMLVGEAPGRTEDETGRPFVGRAGQLLDIMLKSAGLSREQVFIANIVKCRPPENRLPLPPEVDTCLPNLRAQMRLIGPRIVVLLGALASQTLVNPAIRVTRDRGKWYRKDGVDYLVTFHPAAVLRDENNKKRLVLEDFQSLKLKWEEIQSGRE
jgi:uracil-DNA glycosylase family 4